MEKHIISMLGEKDHGKSTLLGNLLIQTGAATEHRINEAKKYTKKGRFEPGYILDSFEEERNQEMTIDTTRAEVVYKGGIYEFIDVPGHLELIKNMMSGASHGEVAILLVSVKKGEGLKPQTKRHIFLSSMFGLRALIVAVNKIDTVNYGKGVFEATKATVSKYLDSINFTSPVVYVPISAYNGENLISKSANMKWYDGPTIIDALVGAFKGGRTKGGSGTRAIVQDVIDHEGKEMVFSMLASGSIKSGQKVRVWPSGEESKVRELYLKGEKAQSAGMGNNIALLLDGFPRISRGDVISGGDEKPASTRNFGALIFLIARVGTAGKLELKMNNNAITASISKVNSVTSPITGTSAKPDGSLPASHAARVQITLDRDYPVERFAEHKELGRFALYSNGKFSGIGIVL